MNEDRAQWEGKILAFEPQSSVPPLSSTSCTLEDRGTTQVHMMILNTTKEINIRVCVFC